MRVPNAAHTSRPWRVLRHVLVYPPMLREYGRRWNAGTEQPSA